MNLIYHRKYDSNSRFEAEFIKTRNSDRIGIICPYLNLHYLKPIEFSNSEWRVVTDLTELFSVTPIRDRNSMVNFIIQHQRKFRSCHGVHAKLIIGDDQALFGSANFTRRGLTDRNELSAVVADKQTLTELWKYFDDTWASGNLIERGQIHELSRTLPEIKKPQRPQTDIVYPEIQMLKRVQFQGACGYYTGEVSTSGANKLCVFRGSKAKPTVSEIFKEKQKSYYELRERLLSSEILERKNGYLEFTRDYVFDSPSAAATVIAGTATNGKKDWTNVP